MSERTYACSKQRELSILNNGLSMDQVPGYKCRFLCRKKEKSVLAPFFCRHPVRVLIEVLGLSVHTGGPNIIGRLPSFHLTLKRTRTRACERSSRERNKKVSGVSAMKTKRVAPYIYLSTIVSRFLSAQDGEKSLFFCFSLLLQR